MTTVLFKAATPPDMVVQFHPTFKMTDEQFFEFCQLNQELHIERTAHGEIIIMSPTGSETGNRNFNLAVEVGIWARQDGTGLAFDSSTGFTLPNGAVRSPDVSWIKRDRWEQLTPVERIKFAPICPDFVVELLSPSDMLKVAQEKMQEYIENGAQLGWLIDRQTQQVYVYTSDGSSVCLEQPTTLVGESVLPGFVLDLSQIW